MADVNGRGLRKPRVQIITTDSGARFRVDDDANPEFWLEVWCSKEELRRVLADINRDADDDHWERVNENQCPD